MDLQEFIKKTFESIDRGTTTKVLQKKDIEKSDISFELLVQVKGKKIVIIEDKTKKNENIPIQKLKFIITTKDKPTSVSEILNKERGR
jgi:hypothetical protein